MGQDDGPPSAIDAGVSARFIDLLCSFEPDKVCVALHESCTYPPRCARQTDAHTNENASPHLTSPHRLFRTRSYSHLVSRGDYPLRRTLVTVKKHGVVDATAFLLARTGHAERGMELMLGEVVK